ncbi:MAG TPA: hypothetical protein VGV89_00210 [Thermoplasmata archaeon]|nr:hypothetical protein [Thermoplasmata archaeon]
MSRRRVERPRRESDLAPAVRAHLESQGFRVWVDPDGADFFDVVARRGEEVGLVELKLADWKTLLRQAVVRRTYGDWVAVALSRRSLAVKLLERAGTPNTRPIGIWSVEGPAPEVLRAAEPWPESTRSLFVEHRDALRLLLDTLEAGGVPEGARWTGFAARSGRGAGTRSSREWRLDEFPDEGSTRSE